jgi:mannitol/fructose-specific phosphotransferase system IIA component (Ntr-type)
MFYISENQKEKITAKINKYLKNTIKYGIVVKNHWNAVKNDLPDNIRGNDLILISMGARQKLFRSPSADKYPIQLSDRFKQNNIFAVYSPLSLVGTRDDDNLFMENIPQEISRNFKLETLETQKNDFESIIGSKTRKNKIPKNEIYNILFSSLESYPVELISGVVLIHAHTEAIQEPRIFVWFQKEKREISPSKTSANVLITVLNPLNGDPQIHLKTLSRIAGLFMNPKCGEIIENCENSEELVQKLLGNTKFGVNTSFSNRQEISTLQSE